MCVCVRISNLKLSYDHLSNSQCHIMYFGCVYVLCMLLAMSCFLSVVQFCFLYNFLSALWVRVFLLSLTWRQRQQQQQQQRQPQKWSIVSHRNGMVAETMMYLWPYITRIGMLHWIWVETMDFSIVEQEQKQKITRKKDDQPNSSHHRPSKIILG